MRMANTARPWEGDGTGDRPRVRRPQRAAFQIDGDLYDFIWHDPSHLGLAVGDVAGTAISAALYMARLPRSSGRAPRSRGPARLLRRVNQEIAQFGDDGRMLREAIEALLAAG